MTDDMLTDVEELIHKRNTLSLLATAARCSVRRCSFKFGAKLKLAPRGR